MTPSKTLRELNALDASPANLANATLVLVDYQNTYTHGVMELTGWKPACPRTCSGNKDHSCDA